MLLRQTVAATILDMARKTIQEFVEQSQRVHGNKFDYSEVEYVNTHTPVKIRCNQCGLVFLHSRQ